MKVRVTRSSASTVERYYCNPYTRNISTSPQIASQICRYATLLGYCEFDAAAQLGKSLSTRASKNMAAILEPVEIGKLLCAIDTYQGDISVRLPLQSCSIFFSAIPNCAAHGEYAYEEEA